MYSLMLSLMIILLSVINFKVVDFMIIETSKAQLNESSKDLQAYLDRGEMISDLLFEEASFNSDIQVKIVDDKGQTVYEHQDSLFDVAYDTNLNTHQIVEEGSVDLVILNEEMVFGDKKVYAQLAIDMDNSEDFMGVMYRSLLVINTLGVMVSILAGIYLTKKTLKPIEDITETAKNISIHDLSERIHTSGPDDELKNLARTFNDMIDRLEKAINRQKRFVSDASHELRTPISVIQGYANLLDRWGKKDEAVLDESVKAIKSEAENMKTLFEQLLALAKEDDESYEIEADTFYLNHLIDETVRELRLIHQAPQIEVLENPEITIQAEEKSLKQVVRIILDNSLKYTAEDGFITVSISRFNHHVRIVITDNGIGIAEDDLPYVFDRFYRADKSRSKEKAGTGLGLSIAKWIVKRHKGKIYVKSELRKGTQMIVELPLKQSI